MKRHKNILAYISNAHLHTQTLKKIKKLKKLKKIKKLLKNKKNKGAT